MEGVIKTLEVNAVGMGVVTPRINTTALDQVIEEWRLAGWKLQQIVPINDCRGSTCKLLLVFKG